MGSWEYISSGDGPSEHTPHTDAAQTKTWKVNFQTISASLIKTFGIDISETFINISEQLARILIDKET